MSTTSPNLAATVWVAGKTDDYEMGFLSGYGLAWFARTGDWYRSAEDWFSRVKAWWEEHPDATFSDVQRALDGILHKWTMEYEQERKEALEREAETAVARLVAKVWDGRE